MSSITAFINKIIKFISASIREYKDVINGDSYYPELERKSKIKRTVDLLKWFFKYKEMNRFYNLFGFDTHDVDESYLNDNSFLKTRNSLNKINTPKSKVSLLRDKFVFYKYMAGFNQPVPKVFGIVKGGKVFDSQLEPMALSFLKEKEDYFVKEIDGECASFVVHIKDFNDFCQKAEDFGDRTLIMQERVFQSAKMNEINPYAINTIRMNTVRTKDGIKVLSTVLRIGTQKTGGVDNWAAGGISVGVKDDGYLEEYGLYKPGYGGRVSVHPNTGVIFKDFCIPNFEAVKRTACKAHEVCYGIHSIGWDIAITEDGPIFIEGNDNWEISLMQACNHGLRNEWTQACK